MQPVAAPILAGGRGKYMRPPTDRCPKSLLAAWLEDRFLAARGDGARRGPSIRAMEGREHGGTLERLAALNLESP